MTQGEKLVWALTFNDVIRENDMASIADGEPRTAEEVAVGAVDAACEAVEFMRLSLKYSIEAFGEDSDQVHYLRQMLDLPTVAGIS